jgi:hypothetical protein
MLRRFFGPGIAAALVAAVLSGCGGGGDASVGGTVSGLDEGAAVRLQLNGDETLVVPANGPFRFEDEILAGRRYEVTVVGQPARASCTVTNGSGRIGNDADRVDDVAVVCTRAHAVGGTVSGLATDSSVRLQLNDDTTVTVSRDGTFRFPTRLPQGSAYAVTVEQEPEGGTCTVEAGTGTVAEQDVTDIAVICG